MDSTPNYQEIARQVRRQVLEMVHRGQTSHIGSNFSVVDLAVVLYENLRSSDQVVWSKGWAAATIYTMLARSGVIPLTDLDKFPHEPYIGLAEPSVQGVITAGGSMGHGLPVTVGMAIGQKRANQSGMIYCIMSDGEMDEDTTWQSAMVAAHHQLDNVAVLIDYNKWQAMGRTNEVLNLEPLRAKWESFGWIVREIDGHNYLLIEQAIKAPRVKDRPYCVIAHTIKGKGVSFMEDHLLFHYKYVDDTEYQKAMAELV